MASKVLTCVRRGTASLLDAMSKSFHEQVMKTFAKELRKARKAAGFGSAESFAHELGVEPHTYRHWERGESSPPLPMFVRICRLLSVDPLELIPMASKKGATGDAEGKAAA